MNSQLFIRGITSNECGRTFDTLYYPRREHLPRTEVKLSTLQLVTGVRGHVPADGLPSLRASARPCGRFPQMFFSQEP